MMKATCASDMSADFQQTTLRYTYRCENLNKFSSCLTENVLSSLYKDKLVNVKVDIRSILRDSLHWYSYGYNTEFNAKC
jgi:hypothetical protein